MNKHEFFVYVNGVKCLVQCQCLSTLFYMAPVPYPWQYICGECGAMYDDKWKLIHEDADHNRGVKDSC